MNAPTFLERPESDAPVKALPSSVEAEQALLGCVLLDNTAVAQLDGLAACHFYEPLHQRLFEDITARIARGALAEPISVMERFKEDPAFKEFGGLVYLSDLIDKAPPTNTAAEYARLIYDAALRREAIQLAHRLIEGAAGDSSVTAHQIIAEAEQALTSLARGAEPGDANLHSARDAAMATLDELEDEAAHGRAKGKMTGLRCFDRRLRGLRPGHLIIVAGRPSMGKSGLARQALFGAAARNPDCTFAFFSLEMERREIIERGLSELTWEDGDGIAYQDMSGDKLDLMQRRRLKDLAWKVPKNLAIDDTSGVSVDYIERRVWAMKRKGNLAAIAIDYLQIMERPKANGRNDAAVIGEMTTRLKTLGRKAGISVVLLSQINRGVESRDDKRPQLSDLRESGSIEQDANSVLFPYREVYYLERAEPKDGSSQHIQWADDVETLRRRMDVGCAKNRGGAVGTDTQDYYAEFDAVRDVREER
jgi:replicative DNA helicase